MLAARGALIIDADDLARQAVEPGTTGLQRVVDAFGPEVLMPDGSLDREAVAARVFADPEDRRTLESITHPEVFRLWGEEIERYRDTDAVVVFDAPLIVEAGAAEGFDVLIVVTASVDEQVRRLTADRGLSEEKARARIEAQYPLEKKEAVADIVIGNDGSIEDLERRVDDLWRDLLSRAAAG